MRLDGLLRPATLKAMSRVDPGISQGAIQGVLGPGMPYLDLRYSPGFEIVRLNHATEPMVCKNGSFPGFASWFVWLPQRRLALAASCNNDAALMDLLLLMADLAKEM